MTFPSGPKRYENFISDSENEFESSSNEYYYYDEDEKDGSSVEDEQDDSSWWETGNDKQFI